MRFFFRKVSFFILTLSLLFANSVNLYAKSSNVQSYKIFINGQEAKFSEPPLKIGGVLYVASREFTEKSGSTFLWNKKNKQVSIILNEKSIIMKIDDSNAIANGVKTTVTNKAKMINSKSFVPLRFVSDNLGYSFRWDEKSKTAHIDKKESKSDLVPDVGYLDLPKPDSSSAKPSENTQINNPDVPVANNNSKDVPSDVDSDLNVDKPTNIVVAETITIPAIDISNVAITETNSALTRITDIKKPQQNNSTYFKIEATSEISKVDKILLPDNRLVIDIYNAELKTGKTEEQINDSNVLKIVQSQNKTSPVNVTRVIFYLKGGVAYNLSLSDDRKTLTLDFVKNNILDLNISSQNDSDIISVSFKNSPSPNVYPLSNPERIIIEAPNTDLSKNIDLTPSSTFIKKVVSSKLNENNSLITIEIKEFAMLKTEVKSNNLVITLTKPTFKNMQYEPNKKQLTIKKDPNSKITIKDITVLDDYSNLRYILTFPTSYANYLGYGEYLLNDSFLKSLTINNTDLILKENRVLAYDISEDESNIYVKAMLPKDRFKKVLVLDPGHGGRDNGASGNGVVEKEINLDIAKRVEKLANNDGLVKVYLTRTADYYVGLEDRSIFANSIADLFIAIHYNSAQGNKKAAGSETYYLASDKDLTNGISSKRVAEIMQKNLLEGLGTQDRKTHSAKFVVLRYSDLPDSLLEVGFLSSPEEASKLNSEEYRQKTAIAIYKGILEVYNEYKPMS